MTIVDHVAVIGGGVMGSGIGQALLQGGYSVSIRDIEEDILEDARDRMVSGNYGLQRAVDEGYLEQAEMDDALDRLDMTVDLEEAVDGTDLVIEAVPEDLSLKGQVFRELDEATDPDVPLASNTSGFSIAAIANAVDDPSRVVGAHFFNPAQVMNLVEIVKTPQTDDAVTQLLEDIVNDLDKAPIVIDDAPDEYGFVANRAFGALREEARKIVEEGVATEEQVDTALEEGYNLPIGPFSMPGLGEEWD